MPFLTRIFPQNVSPTEISGGYYGLWLPPVTHFQNGVALSIDTLYCWPFMTNEGGSAAAVSFYNTSAAESGRNIRCGIYSDATIPGKPDTLQAEAAVTTLTAAGSYREPTFSGLTLLPNTKYWFTFVADGTFTILCSKSYSNSAVTLPSLPVHSTSTAFGDIWSRNALAPTGGGASMCMSRAFTYAALPASWGTPTTLQANTPLMSWKKT